jgi:cytochrome P450
MTDLAAGPTETIDPQWLSSHFDHLSAQVGSTLYESLDYLRNYCPVALSDAYDDGFYVVTRYEDVLAIAQDWQTWSSAEGFTIPYRGKPLMPILPEQADPPIQREYKKLVNYWFRPAMLTQNERPVRAMVHDLIDTFIEDGACEFMDAFARPMPGRTFFDLIMHASPEEVGTVGRDAELAAAPQHPEQLPAIGRITQWMGNFLESRRNGPPQDDVVNAILHAQIEGRPITEYEALGLVTLLFFGGLDTTAGVLGNVMIRFCQNPEIPQLLRAHPELVPQAVEEMLRLDGSFISIARTATRDTELNGVAIPKGKRVLISWASANRDERQFACPAEFDAHRTANPHIAFGAGVHRCVGSNIARMNLRIAITELTQRLVDIRLDQDPSTLEFFTSFNRVPKSVKITFRPGAKVGYGGLTALSP